MNASINSATTWGILYIPVSPDQCQLKWTAVNKSRRGWLVHLYCRITVHAADASAFSAFIMLARAWHCIPILDPNVTLVLPTIVPERVYAVGEIYRRL